MRNDTFNAPLDWFPLDALVSTEHHAARVAAESAEYRRKARARQAARDYASGVISGNVSDVALLKRQAE